MLVELGKNLLKSELPAAKEIIQKIKELLATPTLKEASNDALLQTSKEDFSSLKQLSKGVEALVFKLKESVKTGDIINSKGFETQLSKLEVLMSPKLLAPENFKPSLLQDTMAQLDMQLTQSTKPEAKGLIEAFTKVLEKLSSATIDELNTKNIPQDVREIVEKVKTVIKNSDPLFSKEVTTLSAKLDSFVEPQKLFVQENVKEILSKDLKALLLQASDEMKDSSHPNQAEISKQIDKALLQIDYYQLSSHLSNTSSLYLPFAWESLEEGSIHLKKDKNSIFYCDIDLKLKEYGELKLKLALHEENQLAIHIYSDNTEFKNIVKENIPILRSSLIDVQITPKEIRLFDAVKKISPYEAQDGDIELGFEVKA